MKKILNIVAILLVILITSGCEVKKNNLDKADIYTTIYPVSYIMEKLYSTDNTIKSIYPNGVDLNNYELTEKQIKEYANGDLFVYIGLGNEKEIAKSFLNENKNILIIDSTYGLSYNTKIEELWLAPNNFLMLVKNVKASLTEYIDNNFVIESIEKNYDEIYKDISWMDAELRNIAKQALENKSNTLICSTNVFQFLEKYGFKVIALDELSKNEQSDLKSRFKNGTYSTIIKLNNEKETDYMKELVNDASANIKNINAMITNDDKTSDYKTIQYENINIIREATTD